MSIDESGIETHRVGLLADIKRRNLAYGLWYLRRQVKARKWRAVRNYFNGYLAEWDFPPEGMRHDRCGRGWTRSAARRRLGHHIVASNLTEREAGR